MDEKVIVEVNPVRSSGRALDFVQRGHSNGVKAVENTDDVHRAQVLNYLRISGLRVGLIMNFGKPKLQYERFVV